MISMITLIYFLSITSTKINQIQHARILNSTSNFQTNCSTCICQCLKSSMSCCYINCYMNNNTCQVIIPSLTNKLTMIIDTTATVYSTNCSTYSNPSQSSLITSENLNTQTTTFSSIIKSTTKIHVDSGGYLNI